MRVRMSVAALAAWTLLVWVGRVRNVLSDDELSGWSFTWRLAVAIGFAGSGLVLGCLLIRAAVVGPKEADLGPLTERVAVTLATVGCVWWLVRGAGILVGDYTSGFKVVHTLLALMTMVVSGLVLRSLAPGVTDRYHPPRYG